MALSFQLLADARRRRYSRLFARWCNGNTEAFGAFIHGSNPCRAALYSSIKALARRSCYGKHKGTIRNTKNLTLGSDLSSGDQQWQRASKSSVVRTNQSDVPWLVAVPAASPGRTVRHISKIARSSARILLQASNNKAFFRVEARGSNAAGKTDLAECASLWLARHQKQRVRPFQIRQISTGSSLATADDAVDPSAIENVGHMVALSLRLGSDHAAQLLADTRRFTLLPRLPRGRPGNPMKRVERAAS